jgi:hypothetical protein
MDPHTLANEEQVRRGEMNAANEALERAMASELAAERALQAANRERNAAETVAARARSRYRALGEEFQAHLAKYAREPSAGQQSPGNGMSESDSASDDYDAQVKAAIEGAEEGASTELDA